MKLRPGRRAEPGHSLSGGLGFPMAAFRIKGWEVSLEIEVDAWFGCVAAAFLCFFLLHSPGFSTQATSPILGGGTAARRRDQQRRSVARKAAGVGEERREQGLTLVRGKDEEVQDTITYQAAVSAWEQGRTTVRGSDEVVQDTITYEAAVSAWENPGP